MFSIVEFNKNIDLTEFYKQCNLKGFYNNCNEDVLHNNMIHFNDFKVFLLYFNDRCIGSVGLHSLEELGILGDNAYRIAVRTCILSHLIDGNRLLKVQNYSKAPMNHYASQFLITACINYASGKPMYISTNDSKVGAQNKVHRTWAKIMNQQGYISDPIDLEYRGKIQSFWKLNEEFYMKNLRENIWLEAKFLLG
jgi:hypothetical protein